MAEHTAGAELDALVLERMLGWRWRRYQWWNGETKQLLWHESWGEPQGDDFNLLGDGRLMPWDAPQVSENIADAWQVVELVRGDDQQFQLFCYALLDDTLFDQYSGGPFEAVMDVLRSLSPLAICKAALYAVSAGGRA